MQTKAVSTIKVASADKSPANRRRTQVKAVSKVIRSRVTAASTAAKTRSPASRRRTQVRAVSKAIPSQVNKLKSKQSRLRLRFEKARPRPGFF